MEQNGICHQRALFEAATAGDWKLIEEALKEGADLRVRNNFGFSALHLAIRAGHCNVALALMDMSDSRFLLEVRDGEGYTPLLLACQNGYCELIKKMVAAGANAFAQTDYEGWTALHIAWNWPDIANYLILMQGFDPDVRDHEGDTALHKACKELERGSIDDVAFLLDHGFSVRARDIFGNTPLISAIASSRTYQPLPALVGLLLERGSRANDRNYMARTALHVLATRYLSGGHRALDIVRELLQFDAQFDLDCEGMTPLDIACCNGNRSMSQELIADYRQKVLACHGLLSVHAILREASFEEEYSANKDENWSMSKLFPKDERRQITQCVKLRIGKFYPPKFQDLIKTFDPIMLISDDPTNGDLPIHVACSQGADSAVLKFIVNQGGIDTLGTRDSKGALPLHRLLGSQKRTPETDAVGYLLDAYPESVELATYAGVFPFVAAIKSSCSASVLFLLLKMYPDVLALSLKHPISKKQKCSAP